MTKAQSITREVYVAIYLRLSRDDQNGGAESMSISNHDVIYKGWFIPPQITS